MEENSVNVFNGETWRDLAVWCLDVRGALEACNNDKKALRGIHDKRF